MNGDWAARQAHYERRVKAQSAVLQAVRTGKLSRIDTRTCEGCGKPAEHYHHDEGYGTDKRLIVVPLCRACHRARHDGMIRESEVQRLIEGRES